MLDVSHRFRNMSFAGLKQNLKAKVEVVGGDTYDKTNGFLEFNILEEAGLASTSMAIATVTLKGDIGFGLLGKLVNLSYGFDFDGTTDWLTFGPFKIDEQSYDVKTNKSTLVGFDLMIEMCQLADISEEVYPQTISSLLEAMAEKVSIDHSINDLEFQIESDVYTGTGHEYRSIAEDIAEVSNQLIYISDSKLVNKGINPTDIVLTKSNITKFTLFNSFGPVDSLVLSRTPQEDNVYASDVDIENINFEVKFENNLLVEADREAVVDELYLKYKGQVIQPFSISTVGIGLLELNDQIAIDVGNGEMSVVIMGKQLIINSGVHETLFCNEVEKSTTRYQYASSSQRRQRQTEFIVDKQEGLIQGVVSEVNYVGERIEEAEGRLSLTQGLLEVEIADRTKQGEDIIEQTSTLISQSTENIRFEITKTQEQVDGLNVDMTIVKTYFDFAEQLTIGKMDSPYKAIFGNESLQFTENGQVQTEISRQQLITERIVVRQSATLGNHIIEKSPYNSNRTLWRGVNL